MKRKKTALLALAAVILTVAAVAVGKLVWDLAAPTPHIVSLRYRGGHPWTGYSTWELTQEDGVAYAVTAYEPEGMNEGETPREHRRTLSQTEWEALDRLVFEELKVQRWPDHTGPDPSEITCQDFWWLSITCEDGASYEKEGYQDYQDGLADIARALAGT